MNFNGDFILERVAGTSSSGSNGSVPVFRLTEELGCQALWSPGGANLTWTSQSFQIKLIRGLPLMCWDDISLIKFHNVRENLLLFGGKTLMSS